MDINEIRAFPTDFTMWINANVADSKAGEEVLARWGNELEAIARVVNAVGAVDFEWEFAMIEFSPDGKEKYLAHKLGVTITNVPSKPQVTYVFRINDENKIVEWTKFAGELKPDRKISIQ